MLAATIWGTLPTWLILAVGLIAAWRISKGGAGAAVSELSAANKVLEASLRDARRELSELRGRTDVAIALGPVLEWTSAHEQRAQERHVGMMFVLDLIAQRLGPDPNGDA